MAHSPKQIQTELLVYGGTEAGIFVALRAARCGLKTVLISETDYLFGFFPSLGAWETHYPGSRAPLSDEVRENIIDHYRQTYGEESKRFKESVTLEDNNPMVTFEPQVAEKVLQDLIDAERNLEVYSPYRLTVANLCDRKLASIICRHGNDLVEFRASHFADCSYTGDLGAAAGIEFSIGRESKADYKEPHAGRIFTRWKEGRFPQASLEGRLNVLPTWTTTDPLDNSTGEGDDKVQDYSYRICLSCDRDNRLPPSRPIGYHRETFAPLLLSTSEKETLELPFHHRWLTQTIEEMMENDHLFHGHTLPGNKRSWNATNFIGAGKDYSSADAKGRREIENTHLNHALGLLYFLQNDPEVPDAIQHEGREWGLAKDEFVHNKHLPPVMYVREARRFIGSYVYREQDCLEAEGLGRAPIHRDGIAFTEFALDSLPCSPERYDGSLPDGQFFEKDKTLPGSLPWRCLLPSSISNLVVPTAPSVTHCAWGTVRQTSCLLHLAEVCAFAVELSIRRNTTLSELFALDLQIHLAKNGTMISFFNDFDMAKPETWKEAALLFGNRGFFADYDARPDEPLEAELAKHWAEGIKSLLSDDSIAPNELASRIKQTEDSENKVAIDGNEFKTLLGQDISSETGRDCFTRREALEIMYRIVLAKHSPETISS